MRLYYGYVRSLLSRLGVHTPGNGTSRYRIERGAKLHRNPIRYRVSLIGIPTSHSLHDEHERSREKIGGLCVGAARRGWRGGSIEFFYYLGPHTVPRPLV